MEQWKDVVGYEGLYVVSSYGRVRRVQKKEPMKITYTPYGTVTLCKNHHKKIGLVHRLVAIAFIPNPENKTAVNHIDGNKRNNIVTNLEWNTYKENCIHAYKKGLSKVSDKCKAAVSKRHSGENHYNAKKVFDVAANTIYPTIRAAAKANGITVQNLHRWLHQGTHSQFNFINN